jgi:hypothetical protein
VGIDFLPAAPENGLPDSTKCLPVLEIGLRGRKVCLRGSNSRLPGLKNLLPEPAVRLPGVKAGLSEPTYRGWEAKIRLPGWKGRAAGFENRLPVQENGVRTGQASCRDGAPSEAMIM